MWNLSDFYVNMNSFGNIYRLTSFGESHGRAVGGVIDGMPPRKVIDLRQLQSQLDRRRPGRSPLTSARIEADRLQILSGVMGYDVLTGEAGPLTDECRHGITLGTPVGFMVENSDARSGDYEALRHVYRPSHADFTYDARYRIRDWRGGGRASGRETVSRVVAGAFAGQLLQEKGVAVSARICRVGGIDNPSAEELERVIMNARLDADSVGGVAECVITGLDAGVGEPVFGKLHQMLGSAMLSIGAVKGVEFGMGFEGVSHSGSEMADLFTVDEDGRIRTVTNNSGGIQGGISNGRDVVMRIAVKPTPTITREMPTVDDAWHQVTVNARGRHDPCILPRVLPVVEAMAAMTVLDAILMRNASEF